MPKMPDKLVLTGCDEKTEWQLPWFIENYYKTNTLPLAIADFGMSADMNKRIRNHPAVFCVMGLNPDEENLLKGWFLKPAAMLKAPGRSVVWVDTDCEVKSDMTPLFNMLQPNKLNMVKDNPWVKRRGELWFNSGVVGFINKPEILSKWFLAIKENAEVGDQEVLHSMLNPITQMTYINELPNEWNVLRLQTEADGYDGPVKIMHWTGRKGNERIEGLIKIANAVGVKVNA